MFVSTSPVAYSRLGLVVPKHRQTAVLRNRLKRRLREAGAVIFSKTTMPDYGMLSSGLSSFHPLTCNPWDLSRVPGGSGGGSSAAVAAGEAPLALGSDTGGSIRQPGALTGTVGVKPTYGGVSRYGLVALANSLDQVGPVTRTVLDSALLHEVIGGHDPMDSTSLVGPVPPVVEAARRGDVAGLRIVSLDSTVPGWHHGELRESGTHNELLGVRGLVRALAPLLGEGAAVVNLASSVAVNWRDVKAKCSAFALADDQAPEEAPARLPRTCAARPGRCSRRWRHGRRRGR